MKLLGLTQLIARLDPVREIAARTEPVSISGLLSAAKPAVTAALASHSSRPLLLVMAHPQAAASMLEEIRPWSEREAVLFPAIEALPYERVRLDRTLLSERERIARAIVGGQDIIVVAPVRALMQPLEKPGPEPEAAETVAVGEQIQLDSLLTRWVQWGYADVSIVDMPGTFARRGGVVDIFPAGAEYPVRIELFGNEVESLRSFDPATQRSLVSVPTVDIHPIASLQAEARLGALESLIEVDVSSLSAEAQTRWLDDLARLEAGASFDEVGMFLPYMVQRPTSLAALFPPESTAIVDTSQEVSTVMSDLWDQSVDVQHSLEQSGLLPVDLRPALVQPEMVVDALSAHRRIDFMVGSHAGSTDWSGLFVPARLFAGRVRAFAGEVARRASQRTVIVSQQAERVEELLAEDELTARVIDGLSEEPSAGVTVLHCAVAEGWLLPGQALGLYTDHELFGRALQRPVKRQPRAPREVFFADFSPGDYVVHLEHGIGRFEEVTRMSFDGTEREYALVQYAGTDRVYVPTDQLERLTRYIGMGEAAPHLNKLGGGEWQRARQRAKAAAADMAEELVAMYSKRMARPGHAFAPDSPWQRELETSFPFSETPDQLKAVEDVKSDMEEARPMDRLVCADVGYGKTEVAVRAAFKAVIDGRQVAFLAPTTILAQQHFETFTERFGAFPVRVEVLSRFRTPTQQKDILRRVASGEVDVLIGTHRILQKDVHFEQLGLIVIDEEQRFGVKHKEHLKKLRETIDVLTLTATPIPRTLHMTLVGIREVSVIETPPEGRLPVKTYLEPFDDRLMREAVLRELDRDGQVYIVHNKVASIQAMADRIRRLVPEARVLVGHGQMDEQQLQDVMLTFAHHKADVLVCSTIIENGLDIPNVNTIIINNAHTLGLTQLYQLRGRVGRSANQAYAYLLYPTDANLSHDALRRVEAIFEQQDLGAGFSIAMKDLEIRGAGNLLGAEQSGHAALVGFDLYTRMVGEAVERLRGVPVEDTPNVTIDLPITMFLPAEYVGNEAERLTLYRRLAGVTSEESLLSIVEEMKDRFGPLPDPVAALVASLEIKLLAIKARVTSLSLGAEYLIVRTEPTGIFDRVSLHRLFGSEARISTNVLRVPRRVVSAEWLKEVRELLEDMVRLRQSIQHPEPVTA